MLENITIKEKIANHQNEAEPTIKSVMGAVTARP